MLAIYRMVFIVDYFDHLRAVNKFDFRFSICDLRFYAGEA